MATKKPFTDEQKDMLMDYLFNKFMNDMMQQKERSEDIYNQPPSTDAIGNEVREAKSNNAFMDMIDKGVNNTKKEGIMTAQQYKQGGDLNYVIEMMKNETDPDKLEELKMQIREMLGTTPYMSIRQDPVRKANEGGDAKEENPLRQFRDDYEMLIGFPSEVLREESKVKMRLLDSDIFEKAKDKEEFKKIFYDEYAPTMKFLDSLSDEERKKALDIILSKRAEREIEDAETEGVGSLMRRGMAMADGGIVHLAPGGSVRTPSTYESKAFEEYIAELGPEFQKKDPDTGKIRGSKGLWNKFVLTKGIKPSSTAATELLNDMRKAKGLSPYISTDMALKGYGKDAVEIATGTKTGQVGAADRDAFYKKSKTIFKEADNMEFKSKNDKYKFIEKQLVKAYPTLAGTGAIATFISNRALGAASFFTPSDLEAQTMYSPEEMEKFFAERKIKEKFQ